MSKSANKNSNNILFFFSLFLKSINVDRMWQNIAEMFLF